MVRLFILLLSLAVATPTRSLEKSDSRHWEEYQASYTLSWRGLPVGTSHHSVHKIGNSQFIAKVIAKPFLAFLPFKSSEESHFRVSSLQIQSDYYEYDTQEKSKHLQGKIYFDWGKKTIHHVFANHLNQSQSLPENALDKMTLYFQLRQDLRQQKNVFHYTVIEPKRTKTVHLVLKGLETIQTPIGTFETVKLEYLSDDHQKFTRIWLAKELDYIIVKLQQSKKGKVTAESTLKTLQHWNAS